MRKHTKACASWSSSADQCEGVVRRRTGDGETVDLRSNSIPIQCICAHYVWTDVVGNFGDYQIISSSRCESV
jgi:hypothetical protein